VTEYWSRDRQVKFARIEAEAKGFHLTITERNETEKPWGGFIKFDPECLDAYRAAYWQHGLSAHWNRIVGTLWQRANGTDDLSLDAKLLLLAPGQRLSLQAHERRSELWRVLEGPVVVVCGDAPEDLTDHEVRPGEIVRIPHHKLHRAAAPATGWGVIAEFWEHTEPHNPSDEDDILRYEDDYDRAGGNANTP